MGTEAEQKPEFIDVRLSVPWGELSGRWYGNRKVRPMLAVHGWLDNLGTFNTLIPLLPKHIGVLAFDLPGHGRSSKFPRGAIYHFEDFIMLILRIMNAYKWEKVSLLAHSLGATVSITFASLYPSKVDMLISIDMIRPFTRSPKLYIDKLSHWFEKTLIEEERLESLPLAEPPSYSVPELKSILHKGTFQSVPMENTGHLLERNIKKSTLYPEKYYFSRDGRAKYYLEFICSESLSNQLAMRIKDIPFCVLKGSESRYITEKNAELIERMLEINPFFEFHVVKGTHHIHLNNFAEVAAIINPFISRYRPPALEKWSVDEVEPSVNMGRSEPSDTNINQFQKYRSKL